MWTNTPSRHTGPGLGVTYEGFDLEFLERALPLVDFLEVTPDTIAEVTGNRVRLHEQAIEALASASQSVKVLAHGVGLSIGSHDGWSERYINLLDQLVERVPLAWHSEHLAFTQVDGEALGTMLPVPRTDEALDLICERVQKLYERYHLPFLLEHVIRLLPEPPAKYTEAAFLNEICRRTGCGLILDLYNLECDAHNNDFNVQEFLAELELNHVHELHLACGTEKDGLLLDVHSRPTRESTLVLAEEVLERNRGSIRVVTFELLKEFYPILTLDGVVAELTRLRERLLLASA